VANSSARVSTSGPCLIIMKQKSDTKRNIDRHWLRQTAASAMRYHPAVLDASAGKGKVHRQAASATLQHPCRGRDSNGDSNLCTSVECWYVPPNKGHRTNQLRVRGKQGVHCDRDHSAAGIHAACTFAPHRPQIAGSSPPSAAVDRSDGQRQPQQHPGSQQQAG
jgi:hypothetical protein